ncbi:hypothetical protein NLK61_27420 [Pseudomonas fuscovaginae UPB0736]|uniref:hypothetical protein n=1 Tax=Pseudomonas asplenii TaxID=53407 RepID=UPI00028936A0|nr:MULTISPECIES: hypothetical protein [Pseudomonas]UUQ64880.1 hypothetical protein NLK61_27420 [Pseudomonas fuscovaginae UPB0736]UZE26641.1 hypothetical protein LOY63_14620 [Pseudomonas asplenii]
MSAEEKIDTAPPAVVTKSTSQFPWVLALPLLGFVGYAAPYVTGLIYWQHYLRGLSVPSGLFEAEARDYFVFAYVALIESLGNWAGFLRNPLVWLSIAGIILALSVELVVIKRLEKNARVKSIVEKYTRNRYVALTSGLVVLSAAITTVLMLIPLIMLPVMLLPGVIGEYGAKQTLKRDQEIFSKGCDFSGQAKKHCYVVKDGEKIVASGFLVATSGTRLAIYENGRPKIIPLKDYSVEILVKKEDDKPAAPQEH